MKVYLDGSFLAYRSKGKFYSNLFHNHHPIGTIYSVLRDLTSLANRYENQEVSEWGIAWDSKPTYRLELSPEYKGQRRADATPDEIRIHKQMKFQMKELRVFFKHLGFNQYSCDGYEADDVLATLAKNHEGQRVDLVLNDKDLYQCLTPTLVLWNMKEEKNEAWFRQKYDIAPEQWIDVQSITGDAVDNIQGISGVGEKTALKMLRAYKTLDGVVESVSGKSGIDNLADKVELARKLVMLVDDLELKVVPAEPDRYKFRGLLIRRGLKKHLAEISKFEGFGWKEGKDT